MEHRGGVGADGEASDGAGVLTAIPWRVLEPWLAEQRLAEPRPFSTAVGMVFLPREPGKRNLARELVAKALRDEGLVVVGWRPVPLRPEALPASVRERHPHVEQVVAQSPTLAGDELERALLLARRAVGKALLRQPVIRRLDDLYICSLSSRTVVYKGMVTAPVLPEFYPDLQDPAFVSHFAVLHRRFSTNTAPKWSLAQPMRLLGHNGEINTLLGNLAWMRAREPELAAPVWGARIAELLPVVHGDSSDSGALDKFVELLVRSGRSPLEALMMAMPAAYEHAGAGAAVDPRVTAFYEYYAGLQEAWDGPALVVFADGRHAGACVDRNGLRPARYALTRSGLLALASEAGAVDLPGEEIVEKGRLGPGQMIAVDFEHGRLLRDEVVKSSVASRRPYAAWLGEQRRVLAAQPFDIAGDQAGPMPPSPSAAGAPVSGGVGSRGAGLRSVRPRRPPPPPGGRGVHRRGRRAHRPPHGPPRQGAALLDGQRRAAAHPLGQAARALRLLHRALRPGHQPRHRPAAREAGHVPGRQAGAPRRPAHRGARARARRGPAVPRHQQGGDGGPPGSGAAHGPGLDLLGGRQRAVGSAGGRRARLPRGGGGRAGRGRRGRAQRPLRGGHAGDQPRPGAARRRRRAPRPHPARPAQPGLARLRDGAVLERPPLRVPHRLWGVRGAPVSGLRDGARPVGARPSRGRRARRRGGGRRRGARGPRGGPAPLPRLRRGGPAQDPLQDGHLAAGQLPRRPAVRGGRPRHGPHRACVHRHALAHRRSERGGARPGDGVDPPAGVPRAHRGEAAGLRVRPLPPAR